MKKRLFKVVFTFVAAAVLAFQVNAQSVAGSNKAVDAKEKKILVVYYSYSGNTGEIAKYIQKETGADIFEIKTVKQYKQAYNDMIKEAKEEIQNGYKPELKTKLKNIEAYDVIFIGSPNWWSTIAPAVTAFLTEYDLSGKTVVPFFTHGGGGMANCASDIAKLMPNSTVLEGKTFSGSSVKNAQKDVAGWISKLELKK